MAAFTKLVIMRVFENLLSVKPLEKITVKDITDQCGICLLYTSDAADEL